MVPTTARKFHLALLALLALLVSAVPSYGKCDPTTDPDKSDVANARAAVADNCDCAGATTHGAYVSCAVQRANLVLVNPSCKGAVKKCAAHSTCGKPTAVTCCLTTTKGTKCKVKKDAAHCTAKQGTVGSCTSCCDACPFPGSGPTCPGATTTTATSPPTTSTTAASTTSTTAATTSTTTTTMCTECGPCGGASCGQQGVCATSGGTTCRHNGPGDVCLSVPNNCHGPCSIDTDCAASEACVTITGNNLCCTTCQ